MNSGQRLAFDIRLDKGHLSIELVVSNDHSKLTTRTLSAGRFTVFYARERRDSCAAFLCRAGDGGHGGDVAFVDTESADGRSCEF